MTRIRFRFARYDSLKHISHLDMMRLFQRALRRSGLPLVFSEGYNPHLRFNLAAPLPVNVTASEEYGEVFLAQELTPDQFISALTEQLPKGLIVTGAFGVDRDEPSLPALVSAALYRAKPVAEPGCRVEPKDYREALERLLARQELLVPKTSKKRKKKEQVNVRPYIFEAYFKDAEDDRSLELYMLLQSGSRGGVSPFVVIEQLKKELRSDCNHKAHWELHREKLYQEQNQFLQPLSEGM